MLKNYILIALRNLQRNTVYSFINVTGLSIGLACSILILLWVADEMSYDRFHANYDQVCRVQLNQEISSNIQTSFNAPYPLMEALQNQSSQIKHVALTTHDEGFLLGVGENKVTKMGVVVSEDFFNVFKFKMIKGNLSKVLSDPSSIILTQSTAKALFGNKDALNEIVKIENKHELKVSGIIEDVPSQSTLQFEFLLPFSYYESTQEWVKRSMTSWNNNSYRMFVELQPNPSIAEINNAIQDIVKVNNEKSPTAKVFLHPMHQWHLYSEFTNGKVSGGMIEYVRMFTAIGIFILFIACINFMNLATARSESRAREVGIRKSVGSRRKQLIMQFLGESLVITSIAFLFALVIVELALPFYNVLVNKTLLIDYSNPWLWFATACIIIITGLVAGSYPAFYLSSFQPVKVLKGKGITHRGSVAPRKVMVTVQFSFSIFLIIGTLVIYQQIVFVKARHMGYDRENLMLIWTTAEREKNFESLREELIHTGVVKSMCKSSAPITRIFSGTDDISWQGKQANSKVGFNTVATEYDYTETLGIKMLEGVYSRLE
jgi:hypothetical protein